MAEHMLSTACPRPWVQSLAPFPCCQKVTPWPLTVPKPGLPHCRAAGSGIPWSPPGSQPGCTLPSALLSRAQYQDPPVYLSLFYKHQASGSHLILTNDTAAELGSTSHVGSAWPFPVLCTHSWANPEGRPSAGLLQSPGRTLKCPSTGCFLTEQVLLPNPNPMQSS